MDRMKTFLIYALLIIGFFVLSIGLENGLLKAMYTNLSGEFDGNYSVAGGKFTVHDVTAKACNVNGYINFSLTNETENFIERCYLKIDLYNKEGLLADTEYVEVANLQPGDTRDFAIKFKANHIEKFKISVEENMPDKTNIIDVFGWEVDLTNVFGLGIDLSNVTIFGTKLTDIFSWNNIKSTGQSFWNWMVMKLKSATIGEYFIIWWLFFF